MSFEDPNNEELSNLLAKGIGYKLENDLSKALIYFQQCLEVSLKLKKPEITFTSLNKISEIHRLRVNFTQSENIALRAEIEARNLLETTGDVTFLLQAKRNIINCFLMQNKYKEILDEYKKVIKLRKKHNKVSGTADEARDICRELVYRGQAEISLKLLSFVLELLIQVKDENQQAIILSSIADIEVVKGRSYEKALTTYEESLRLFRKTSITKGYYRAIINYARTMLLKQEEESAKIIIDAMEQLPEEYKTKEEQLLLKMIQSETLGRNDFLGSLQSITDAIDESKDQPWLFSEILLVMSQLCLNHIKNEDTMVQTLISEIKASQAIVGDNIPVISMIMKLFHAFVLSFSTQDFDNAISNVTEALSSSEEKNLQELYIKSKTVELLILNQRDNLMENRMEVKEMKSLIKGQIKEFLSYSIALMSCCR